MKIIVLSNDHFFAQSVSASCSKIRSDSPSEKCLVLVDVMNISDYRALDASLTAAENTTLAFVFNHVRHLHFIDPMLLCLLSEKVNITAISRKAQVFEYQALFNNKRCLIKHSPSPENIFTSAEKNLIHSLGHTATSGGEIEPETNRKCFSARKRTVMKKTHIATHTELHEVVMKNQTLTRALTELLSECTFCAPI